MRCVECGYDLERVPAAVCPECGRGFDPRDPETFERSWLFLGVFPMGIAAAEESLGWRWSAIVGVPIWLGVLAFAAMGALGLWSAGVMALRGDGTPLPFDCPRRLVIAGPYRFVRNPMAIAGLGQGAAVGLMLGSWAALVYVAAGAVLWNVLVRRWEEQDLLERFGDDYKRYRGAVRCWWPRVRRNQGEG